ncbi:branched-chain amino acid ABC transporter substrate-binding protein [Roseibium sp.]|uniref:branched-chain amino acid ABC transporter substrate-binding protein n=1 Tax=Roseibium sp. TaxID=1936156 RepID=UPI003262E8E2
MIFQNVAAGLVLFAISLVPAPVLAEIRIAVAGPMTGQFAAFGAQMAGGAASAVADINAAGGVNGETLVLETVDDGCDADKAVAVANQLIGKEVVFVAGHFCFGPSISASEVYAQAGIIQMSPATTLPKFTQDRPGAGVFRLAPRDDQQADVAGAFLARDHADAHIAFLHDKTAYGKGLVDAVKTVMNGLGKRESLSIGYDAGEDAYRELVSDLVLQNIDVVYLGGYHPEAGLIKLEMVRQGLDAILIAGDALMTDEYWSVTGSAGNGTLLTYPEVPRRMPAAAKVVTAMEEAGLPADRYALTTYAAVQIWAQAARQAQTTGFEDVVDALGAGTFETVLGTVAFDDKGDAGVPAYVWYEWRNGAPVRR